MIDVSYRNLLNKLLSEKVSIFPAEKTEVVFNLVYKNVIEQHTCRYLDIVDSIFLSGIVYPHKIMRLGIELIIQWTVIEIAISKTPYVEEIIDENRINELIYSHLLSVVDEYQIEKCTK